MLQRGLEVSFLTGTDEHGQKIEKAASDNNRSPKEHCDYIAAEFKKLWQLLEIDYDFFRRTSDSDHYKFVTEFFEKVQANGDIYEGEYHGLYCVSCEDFWLEKDLVDGKLCPTHKTAVQNYAQKNYFFRLSKYQEKLKQIIEANPDFICPEYRRNEVLGWIKEGLKDFPISRVGLNWGIPVPGDQEGQKIYVWFDALLGYLSGLGTDIEKIWNKDTKIVHIIGKDILRFHAVYWPAMLISAGYPIPSKVFGHGFLTKDGMKMGKSLGNIIDPVQLVNDYGAEAVKFYFLRDLVFGRDGDYTDDAFIQRLNSDLANNLGNLLSRTLKLIEKYFDSKVPDVACEANLQQALANLQREFLNDIDKLDPYSALDRLFKVLDQANVYINTVEPWKVLKAVEKDSVEYNNAAQSLLTALTACLHAAFYLAPICPKMSKQILTNIGFVVSEKNILTNTFAFDKLESYKLQGVSIAVNPAGIFQRLAKHDLKLV